jgi:hypothetical protein
MQKMSVELDMYTTFYIKNMKKRFGPRNKIILNMPKNKDFKYSSYSKKSLEEYYKGKVVEITDKELNKFDVSSIQYDMSLLIVNAGIKQKGYFILDKIHKLIFIPLINKEKNIISYAFTNLHNLIKLRGYNFCMTGNYVDSKEGLIHEIVNGRKAPPGYRTDHINCDPMDNRDENLRVITNEENGMNMSQRENRGVYENGAVWRVIISKRYIGMYDKYEHALKMWDIAAAYLYPRIVYYDNEILTDEEYEHIENPANKKIYDDLLTIKKPERELPNFVSKAKDSFRFSKKYTKKFHNEKGCKIFIQALKERFPKIPSVHKIKYEKVTEYSRDWYIFHVSLNKSSPDREAIEKLAIDVLKFLKQLEEKERERIASSIDDYRIDGIACIDVYDGSKQIIKKCKVDDEDWVIFIFYQWYDSNGYPRSTQLGMLHISAIERNFPEEYANMTPEETIDHKLNPYDARKENLRIAGKELQATNTLRTRKSICATGVYVSGRNFKAIFKNIIYPEKFKTEEAAARKYKELAEAAGSEKVKDVPYTETTIEDKFGIKNLPNIITRIEVLVELQTIVLINNLQEAAGCESAYDIKKCNFEECKQNIIKYLGL